MSGTNQNPWAVGDRIEMVVNASRKYFYAVTSVVGPKVVLLLEGEPKARPVVKDAGDLDRLIKIGMARRAGGASAAP